MHLQHVAFAGPPRQWTPLERFLDKISPEPNSGYWLWDGSRTQNGYGHLKVGRLMLAHRFSYEHFVGPIPEGMTLDHLCRVRCCVNPEHLEPVSMKENILRGDTVPAFNSRKTHCKRGHPLSGKNLYTNPRGARVCKQCKRRALATHRKKRAHRIASFLLIVASALFVSPVTGLSQERCDSYDSLKAHLETAHKMRETARATQVFPDRKPEANLRFWRNDETGVWAVMRLDPPNCARVIVTGYGWESVGEAAL